MKELTEMEYDYIGYPMCFISLRLNLHSNYVRYLPEKITPWRTNN